MPGTRVDEHMIVERKDGSLWMLIRNTGGIALEDATVLPFILRRSCRRSAAGG